jgi:prepilin-type N-terminal cleavage/methylation domain-containing protein
MLLNAQRGKCAGFTLIEFVVSAAILAIGILALLQTVNFAIVQNNSNKLRNDSILIADQAMGTERARRFDDVKSSSSMVVNKVALGFVNYSVVNTVTPLTAHSLASDHIAGSKNLQIRVAWRDKQVRKTHSLTTTIIETAN